MYVYTYVCINVCTYVCMCIPKYTYIATRIHIKGSSYLNCLHLRLVCNYVAM